MTGEEEIVAQASELIVELDQKEKVYSSFSLYTRRLNHLMRKFKSYEELNLSYKVYETKEANAFATPDGSVRVFSGLMDMLSDDELLGVLGHEVGHVALKHAYYAWRSRMLRSAASDALGAFLPEWSILSDSVLGDVAASFLSSGYSRSQESEADDFGYNFLKEHGYNPWALVNAFEKLKSASEVDDSFVAKILQHFASHPGFDKRISHLMEKATKDGFEKPKGGLLSSLGNLFASVWHLF